MSSGKAQRQRRYAQKDLSPSMGRYTEAVVANKAYFSAQVVGGNVYVVGPITRTSGGIHNSVVAVLDVKRNAWKWVKTKHQVSNAGGMFLYNDLLYWVGRSTADRSRLVKFDLLLKHWEECKTVGADPGSRVHFTSNFLERSGKFVVFGGMALGRPLDSLAVLLMPQQRWVEPKSKGTGPSGRWQHGSCIREDTIYIFGGWGPNSRVDPRIFLLKLQPDNVAVWSSPMTNANIVGAVSSFVFAPLGNELLIIGGSGNTGDHRMTRYNLETRNFSKISKYRSTFLGVGAVSVSFESEGLVMIFGIDDNLSRITTFTAH